MKVFVTGGAGYVGSRLVRSLLSRGHDVRVLDKLVFGASALADVEDKIDLIVDDVRGIDPKALDGVDAILHLAGLSNDPTAEFNPEANKAINLDATTTLAGKAKDCGISRFVFASSCSVYYTLKPDDALRDEAYPVSPEAPYSWSKHQAELGLLDLVDDDFCPVVLRKGTVFGQSERMRYDLVVNTMTKDAFRSRKIAVHAGGRMWRPMLHVDDAVDAYLAALEADADIVRGEVFNVSSGNFRVLDLATAVRRALRNGRDIAVDVEVQPVGVSRSYRVDGTKLREKLGLELERSVEDAVEPMWARLADGIDVDDPIHYNIRWLELLCDMEARLSKMGGSPF